MSAKRTLEEFIEKVLYYKNLSINMPLLLEHTVTTGLYDMQRQQLINVLVNAAKQFVAKLVSRCVTDYQAVCREYEYC